MSALLLVFAAVGCGPDQDPEDIRPGLDLEQALKETKHLSQVTGKYRGTWASAGGTISPFGMELRLDMERRPYDGEGNKGRRYVDIPVAGGQLYLFARVDDPETPENEDVPGGFTWIIDWGTYEPGSEIDTGSLSLKVTGPDGRSIDVRAKFDHGRITGTFKVRDGLSRFSVRMVEKY